MKRYEFIQIWGGNHGGDSSVQVWSTKGEVLRWISKELQKLHPKCEITTSAFGDGEAYFCLFKKLEHADTKDTWWIIKQLCSQGWQPISGSYDLGPSSVRANLVLEVEADSQQPG